MKLQKILFAMLALTGFSGAAQAQTADSTGAGRLWGSSARVQPTVQQYVPAPTSTTPTIASFLAANAGRTFYSNGATVPGGWGSFLTPSGWVFQINSAGTQACASPGGTIYLSSSPCVDAANPISLFNEGYFRVTPYGFESQFRDPNGGSMGIHYIYTFSLTQEMINLGQKAALFITSN